MNPPVTLEAENAIADIARRHGLSRDAVLAMLLAVNNGGGTMAQFNIPELGGSGQWMRGGMTMVGDMFNHSLKSRVDSLCNELSNVLATISIFPPAPAHSTGSAPNGGGFPSNNWWPADLGVPSSTGGQNDVRYAIFPATRRLAIQVGGVTRVFDTAEHQIGGVQQQQGSGYGSVSFSSQYGTFDVSGLRELGAQQITETPVAAPAPRHAAAQSPDLQSPNPQSSNTQSPSASEPTPNDPAAIVAAIESLANLHQRGILSDDEFTSKKAELLARL
ncbi:SHOCT domain-containing protein [Gordonia sp. zg691]|uniref:SHOCT domain-containing protein n=1 Tax=Gordonia jinghuaiqii TaxID=2758710 RepID=UPI0016623DF5|nr:SHOCT domain-containing protein [Gordonia jinghuaiqii]MBD0860666.1 SHOCT domain-containing protein [Gordonia jinghuaiqii]